MKTERDRINNDQARTKEIPWPGREGADIAPEHDNQIVIIVTNNNGTGEPK